MSTLFWVGLPLHVSSAAFITFTVFGNGWPTFLVSLGLQTAFWILMGRAGRV